MLIEDLAKMGINVESLNPLTYDEMHDLVTGLKKIAEIYVRLGSPM